ncbi:MAG: polysaccharide pyruvyl transferase CsaB [Elusimicrobiota bacterium]
MDLNFSATVSGYYGFKNLGDHIILKNIIAGFQKFHPSLKLNIFVKSPKNNRNYNSQKIDFINRYNPWKIFTKLFSSRVFIMGGGSILQDTTGFFTIYYYLLLIIIAKCLNNKVVIFNQGIGPVESTVNRQLVKFILSWVDLIIVRDIRSKKFLSELLPGKEIILGADHIFFDRLSPKVNSKKNSYKKDKICSISIRKWKNNKVFQVFKKTAEILRAKGWQCFNIAFQTGKDNIDENNHITNINWQKPKDIIHVLKNSDFLIGMRLHSLMLGAKLNLSMLGIVYDPKVETFCKYMNIPRIKIDHITPERLINKIQNNYGNTPDYREKITLLEKRLNQSWNILGGFLESIPEKS